MYGYTFIYIYILKLCVFEGEGVCVRVPRLVLIDNMYYGLALCNWRLNLVL